MKTKLQVAILFSALTIRAGAMENMITEVIKFNGCDNTINNYLKFVSNVNNKYSIKKLKANKELTTNKKIRLIIPAQIYGHKVTICRKAFAGLKNENLQISLKFQRTRAKQKKFYGKPRYLYRYQRKIPYSYVRFPCDLTGMFKNSCSITDIDFSGVSRIRRKNGINFNQNHMSNMFAGCVNLQRIIWGNFSTRSVTKMDNMFKNCKNLESLSLNHFDTSLVQTMKGMFSYCHKLCCLRIDKIDTSNVRDMASMFLNCKSLAYLNLEGLNTQSVQSMDNMFKGCQNLSSLNLDNFRTKNLNSMYGMFKNCRSLVYLNLSKFAIPGSDKKFKNTTSIERFMESFITGCTSLSYVDYPKDVLNLMNSYTEEFTTECINCIYH